MTAPRAALKIGCLADDFTGATDLASHLVRAGMKVIQTIGLPEAPLADGLGDADAVVIALKTRTAPVAQAVAESLQALEALQAAGARQIYFKYCSTFDSTPQGNIGPVSEALMAALGTDKTIACPALPDNGRTVYQGHLFVGHRLLHESGMQHHPLTPMTDPDLVRVLQAQARRPVGLVDLAQVRGAGLRERLAEAGPGHWVTDALTHDDLLALGAAVAGWPLVTGGSGLALGLPQNFGLQAGPDPARLPPAHGLQAIVSGSCSVRSNEQVARFVQDGGAARAIDPLAVAAGQDVLKDTLDWARLQWRDAPDRPVLVHATDRPEAVARIQRELGVVRAGALVEQSIAGIATALVQLGVGRLVVAGGETSGACVQALGIQRLQIGASIAPGVPWCYAEALSCRRGGLHIALKSGNFGAVDFFHEALRCLP